MGSMVKGISKILLPVFLAMPVAGAQTAAVPRSVEEVLHRMSGNAAVIFIGQVVAIRPHLDPGTSSGYVEVSFRIERPVRGCAPGIYTLREWSGLWQGSAGRYRVGQRLLMFLHAPGASGMSSPVNGMDGAVPLRSGGATPLQPASGSEPDGQVVDLRWLATQVERSGNFTLHAPLSPTPLALTWPVSAAPADVPLNVVADTGRASIPVQQASVDTVMKLLLSWQKASSDAAR